MKPGLVFVLVLMAAGAALTAWGIGGAPASDRAHEPADVERGTPPLSFDTALVQRGAIVQQLNCAGCHAVDGRAIGPGFLEIARRYRDVSNPGAAVTAAMLHPASGLPGYPPAPPQAYLSREERDAVAAWILDLSQHAR
jgi:cytochrome c551/c552